MTAPAIELRDRGEHAAAYAERLGWAVVPLHYPIAGRCSCGRPHDGTNGLTQNSIGKHPVHELAPHGVHSASKDADRIREWWRINPMMNIGIVTGSASGIAVVDVDPRNGGDITWDEATKTHGEPATVNAMTGGAGRHIVFRYDPARVIRKLGKGIDVKSDGGLIVVEPSSHVAGRNYSWDAEADPLHGAEVAAAPEWLTVARDAPGDVTNTAGRAIGFIPEKQFADLIQALRYISPDLRDIWRDVGAALHSTGDTRAFSVWCDWAKGCPEKYTDDAQRRLWRDFDKRQYVGRQLHIESIFFWAIDAGWPGAQPVAVPVESIEIATPRPAGVASSILELPGALGEFARWTNATAPRPQPAFAVSAALALGAAACGRRYRTTRNNYSSLYLVNVGKSGSGKEHARTSIYAALTAADWPQLIGRSGFSSDSAVVSTLLLQPAQITVIDEIGALLGNMQAEGAFMARSAVTSLVEAWGNLHGTMRPKALSMLSATREQIEKSLGQVVHNPALTLLGMTTPRTFYGALTESSIEGGFLSRLIVIETDIGRTMPGTPDASECPASVVGWLKSIRTHQQQRGNLGGVDAGPDAKPITTEVPIDRAAQAVFDAYMRETISSADLLEHEGMAELEVRSVEKAMRIALILAVSSDPYAPTITRAEAEWAVAYVKHWTARTVQAVRENMHGGKFAQWQAEVLRVVSNAGERGRTESELPRYSRQFNTLEPRQRRMVLDALASRGSVALVEIKSPAGRVRKAWVALDESVDSGDNS